MSPLGRRGHFDRDRPSFTVADVAGFIGQPILGSTAAGQCVVTGIRDDSRAVSAGDAYVAIPGRTWHGLQFEAQAAAAGAVVVISDRPGRLLPSIVVPDPRAVVGPLAAWFHGAPSSQVRVLGVTGTNGKTSTCHFLYAGLTASDQTAGLICGSRIQGPGIDEIPNRTTPEAASLQSTLAQFRSAGVTACAMEVSSHAVSERRVDGTFYRVMAFTNLSRDHLDYHGSMERYFAAKATLFDTDRTEHAVINIDDPYGGRLARSTSVPVWTCSMTDPTADVHVQDVQVSAEGTRFTTHTPQGQVEMALQTLGPHQVPNAMVALTTLAANGCDIHAAAAGISSVPAIPGRCERVEAGQDFTAIVDYMHNTAGQHSLLPFLRKMTAGHLILVIGATGGRDLGKRRPLGATAATYADIVIVTDESPLDEDPAQIRSDVLSGARHANKAQIFEIPDRRAAFDLAVTLAHRKDTVVAAGRGNDTLQRYGPQSIHFDDRAQLHQAINEALSRTPGLS